MQTWHEVLTNFIIWLVGNQRWHAEVSSVPRGLSMRIDKHTNSEQVTEAKVILYTEYRYTTCKLHSPYYSEFFLRSYYSNPHFFLFQVTKFVLYSVAITFQIRNRNWIVQHILVNWNRKLVIWLLILPNNWWLERKVRLRKLKSVLARADMFIFKPLISLYSVWWHVGCYRRLWFQLGST